MAKTDISERRRTQRFHMALPLRIVRLSQRNVDLEGKTRDLSSHGAYFVTRASVEPGDPIEFFVTLPEEHPMQMESGERVQLRCLGHVIRFDELGNNGRHGVAATIDRYQFVRANGN